MVVKMTDWRDEILDTIKNRSGLFLAIDPQNVLSLDQKLQTKIKSLGFELLRFSDPIEFRYHYEEIKLRDTFNLIVIWNDTFDIAEKKLVWEILDYCKKNQSIIDCSSTRIFPKLDTNVIEQLNVANYDVMYTPHEKLESPLNEFHTCDFVLHKVFDLSPQIVANSTTTLFRSLLDIHYNSKKLTPILINHLTQFTNENADLESWNAAVLFSDKKRFFNFVQSEWKNQVETGYSKIDFTDKNTNAVLDNLFLEGFLNQIETTKPYQQWMKVGIKIPNDEDIQRQRLQEGVELFEKEIRKLTVESLPIVWQKIATQYGKLSAIADEQNYSIHELRHSINKQFAEWIDKNYKNLWNMSPVNGPIMVHHIIEYLARSCSGSKIALIVIDGLSVTQWQIIQQIIQEKSPELDFKNEAIFAWIPTITSISRQSIFAGTDPFSFKDTLLDSGCEEKPWKEKWHQKYPKSSVTYSTNNNLWRNDFESRIEGYDIIGFVTLDVDDAIHSAKGGLKELNGNVRNWAKDSFLNQLLIKLIEENYSVFISSDHGNTEAIGIGEPNDYAEGRERRCRIYDDKKKLDVVIEKYPQSKCWRPELVGGKYYFLLADENYAFSKKDEKVITHGGMSFDEVMVPFVRVDKIAK